MVTSKITRSCAQHHGASMTVEANKAPHPPQVEDDLILVTSMFVPVQQDFIPLRVEWGTLQALQFFQPL